MTQVQHTPASPQSAICSRRYRAQAMDRHLVAEDVAGALSVGNPLVALELSSRFRQRCFRLALVQFALDVWQPIGERPRRLRQSRMI